MIKRAARGAAFGLGLARANGMRRETETVGLRTERQRWAAGREQRRREAGAMLGVAAEGLDPWDSARHSVLVAISAGLRPLGSQLGDSARLVVLHQLLSIAAQRETRQGRLGRWTELELDWARAARASACLGLGLALRRVDSAILWAGVRGGDERIVAEHWRYWPTIGRVPRCVRALLQAALDLQAKQPTEAK